MIGNINPNEKKVVVIGAGVSGLLIAYALKKKGFQVEVFEASNRVGGLIETRSTPNGLVETGAHSLLVTKEAAEFFLELGVKLDPISPGSRARFIYRDGKMRKMPLKIFEIFGTLLRVMTKPKPPFYPDTGTLEDWGNSYLGKPATHFLLSPFITGIFATTPQMLLAKLAFPKLIPADPTRSLYHHFKKIFKNRKNNPRPKMMAPRNGMSDLVEALYRNLKDEIKLGTTITALPRTENLVITVPAPELSKLIRKEDPQAAEKLLKVSYAPLITASCFFSESDFKKKPKGIGVLIPRGEGLRMLGCLFNSSSFPNRTLESSVSLTVMYGGTEDPEILRVDDEALSKLINEELKKLFPLFRDATRILITRWERAIPIYSSVLKDAQEALKLGFCSQKGRIVFSNFSKDVSIRALIDTTLHL